MNKFNRILSILGLVFIEGLVAQAINAEPAVDIEYAEQKPLAIKSMLLDITHHGNSFVAVGERGHVLISSDGENWVQADHVPTRSTLTSVFSSEQRLWAAGHDAVIITSGDGGKTWTRQFFDPERQQAVMDIYFVDENNGVALGSYGLYLRTADGGKSWQEATVDAESDYHLNQLLDFGDGKWLIAGEAGYSYRSFDTGKTWEAMALPYQGSMWGAVKTNEECVMFYGLRGHALESCDFGSTWIELETGTESSISDAVEYDGVLVLAANSGTLLARDLAGNFSVQQHSSGVDFAAVISLGDGNFLLAGEDGVHKYPEISKRGDGDD